MPRLTRLAMAFGLCTLGACVPAASLRGAIGVIVASQGEIVDGAGELDLLCQTRATEGADLQPCRAARGRVMQGLRNQLQAIQGLIK